MRILFTILLGGAALSAAPLMVSASGTFSSSLLTGTYYAPNATWEMNFNIDSTPFVDTLYGDGTFSTTAIINFSYKLNGVTVPTTASLVHFGQSLSLFNINFNNDFLQGFIFTDTNLDQAFVLSNGTATILTGSYFSSTLLKLGGGPNSLQPETTITIADAVPEPAGIGLAGLGLASVWLLRKSRAWTTQTAASGGRQQS